MAGAHALGLVELRVVLGEVRLDVGVRDVHLRRDRAFEDDLLAQDVLNVGFGEPLLHQDLLELPRRILGLDLRFFLVDVGHA